MKTTMVVVMAVVMATFTMAMGGKVYKVGDSATWTNIGHVDYKTWASTTLFRVGDTIVFQYNKDFQNVARVSYTSFQTCDSAAPFATYTSGNDSFPLKYPGHYCFICTIPGHCQAGQKVDIHVPLPPRSAIPPRSAPIQPLPFPYPPPPVPSQPPVLPSPAPLSPEVTPSSSPAVAPSPTKSSASQLASKVKLWFTLMAVSFYLIGFCS